MINKHFTHFSGGVSGDFFLGREKPLAVLDEFVDAPGCTQLAIYGLPHVGKTSLVMEWQRRLQTNGYRTPQGKELLILFHTVNLSIGTAKGSYYGMLRRLCHALWTQLRSAYKDGRIVEDEWSTSISARLKEQFSKLEDDEFATTEFLEEILLELTAHNLWTVIILDEFERAGQSWSEEEYVRFTELLMNRKLNLRCVVASRPHISYILSNYVRKISPFKPYLLSSFEDSDMRAYFAALHEDGGPDLLRPENKIKLQQLLYSCGRNPYLLTVMALDLLSHPTEEPERLFRGNLATYYQHFEDVTGFMLLEEDRENKSFSHIIKCYFGASEDYEDIIGTYVNLGYIELSPSQSTFKYEHYNHTYKANVNHTGLKIYQYTTVCPAFIVYLYCKKLKYVKDVRDLLTGLIHAFRDITRQELEQLYPNGRGWNEELLCRYRAEKTNRNGTFYSYAIKLPRGSWQLINENDLNNGFLSFDANDSFLCARRNWIAQNQGKMIPVSETSLRFAIDAFNKKINQVMPVLDPINIADNANIILHYYDIFYNYFAALGDKEASRLALRQQVNEIRQARNEISHFSRYGMTEEEIDTCKRRCIYLLESIYNYIDDHIPSEYIPFQ